MVIFIGLVCVNDWYEEQNQLNIRPPLSVPIDQFECFPMCATTRKLFFAVCIGATVIIFCMVSTTFQYTKSEATPMTIPVLKLLQDQISYDTEPEPTQTDFPFKSALKLDILIIVVIEGRTNTAVYKRALDSLTCYSNIHDYKLAVVKDSLFSKQCPHKDKFFRRHCVVAQYLTKFDYLLFLDADMGVINPKRRIEEYINPNFDVTLYDRFYNQEIMAGSYLLKNTTYALDFLKGFADYESRLPTGFHGTDNGALHAYVAELVFGTRKEVYQPCLDVYSKSRSYDDLFTYEACIRAVLGSGEEFGKLRILRKGTGWARDNWLTNSMWYPETDFIIHGWKTNQLRTYSPSQLPILPTHFTASDWYDPIVGEFNFTQCVPNNVTWNYDNNLQLRNGSFDVDTSQFRRETQKDFYRRIARVPTFLV